MLAAKVAGELGADGVIVTTDAGGNSHTDTMLTVRACERAGIRTVALVAEMGGLTDHVPEADAIVSVGNAEELVPEWRPERVIGGDMLLDGRPAADCGPVPVRNYLGATCQMGDMDLRAVTLVKVVHYLNQFFAGLGGEEAAGIAAGSPRGSGRPRAGARARRRRHARVRRRLLRRARGRGARRSCCAGSTRSSPDVLVCGPVVRLRPLRLRLRDARARGSTPRHPRRLRDGSGEPGCRRGRGRRLHRPDERERGRACARRCRGWPRSPRRLAAGEELGPPDEEGYLPRGLRRNERARARRRGCAAIDLLLAKLGGETRTEVEASFDHVAAASAGSRSVAGLRSLSSPRPAACHRGIPTACRRSAPPPGSATRSATEATLAAGRYESVHGGFDVTAANADPNRLVPLDVVRDARARGPHRPAPRHLLHDHRERHARRRPPTKFGQEIADELKEAGVEAVVLSGT